jgi:restriction system protein
MPLADDYPAPALTPEAFELTVKSMLDMQGVGLADYQSNHLEVISVHDGDYEFDITIRFSALSMSYLTLVECKHYKKRVEREKVQALWAKMQSVSAHKGIMFSTAGYQSGAISYAKEHKIGLVHVADGRTSYLTRASPSGQGIIPWDNVPEYIPPIVGWLIDADSRSLLSAQSHRSASLIDFSVVTESRRAKGEEQ